MPFEGRVLALDLATTTGWAFGCPGSNPQCGHIRFTKEGSTRAQTYRVFREWLVNSWGSHNKPDLICYESPAIPAFLGGRTNIETTRLLFGLAEHLEEWAYGCHVELREATTSQIRCHFLGQNLKAKIAKPLTLERCKDFGWECTTTDEADAAALWDYTCCWLNPQLAFRTTPLFKKLK